jgi:hypothetical protein
MKRYLMRQKKLRRDAGVFLPAGGITTSYLALDQIWQ